MSTNPYEPIHPILQPLDSDYEWRGFGMTKKELFAAMFLQALLSAGRHPSDSPYTLEGQAVGFAERLIEELNNET